MTKGGGFSLGARGDHIANLHLVMGDDDVIDEQLYQLSALGKRELVQGGLQPPAKALKALGQPRARPGGFPAPGKRPPSLGPRRRYPLVAAPEPRAGAAAGSSHVACASP